MLQAFVDDSVSNVGDRRFFLAGYVNTADRWIEFSEAWDRVLAEHPRIEFFHMVEAHSLEGQFRGWSEKARDQKILKLAEVIRAFDPWSIECSVSQDAYDQILRPIAPYGLARPYSLCFEGIIVTLQRFHASIGMTLPVDFIFDEHGIVGEEALMVHQMAKRASPREQRAFYGSTPQFRDDTKVLPLQAADMLAWHLRREAENRTGDRFLYAIDLLRADSRHVITELPTDILQSLADQMAKVPNVERSRSKSSWRDTKRLFRASPDVFYFLATNPMPLESGAIARAIWTARWLFFVAAARLSSWRAQTFRRRR